MTTTTIALDIAKEKIHVYGVDSQNRVIIDKVFNRKKLLSFLANHQPVKIFMESCAGSNWLCQRLNQMGHHASRISAQHVKPYASHQKNDRNDARAILEASRRPGALFVGVKSPWQQELQCLHKMRDRRLRDYKALNSQIRGFLFEFGILVPTSSAKFFKVIPKVLEEAESSLSGIIRDEIYELFVECRNHYLKAEELEKKIRDYCSESHFYRKAIEEISGVGPLVASRFLSTISSPSNFRNGRQVSAHLGLVPRQYSSGGRTRLGGITKNGDIGLRTMLIQGARARLASLVKKQYPTQEQSKLLMWVEKKGFNVAAVALANRNARQMWAIMNKFA